MWKADDDQAEAASNPFCLQVLKRSQAGNPMIANIEFMCRSTIGQARPKSFLATTRNNNKADFFFILLLCDLKYSL